MPKNIERDFHELRLLIAIKRHDEEVSRWLKAGGDARLVEYSPLASWGEVLEICAQMTGSGSRKLKAL